MEMGVQAEMMMEMEFQEEERIEMGSKRGDDRDGFKRRR